jgi:hypothetical protein
MKNGVPLGETDAGKLAALADGTYKMSKEELD